MSKKTFIHAENNNKILSSNEVKLYVPPEPEKMKVIIWGKELCNGAEWYDFLKCVEEKTRENDQFKQQLVEKDEEIKKLNWQLKDKDFIIKNLNHSLSVAPNANAGQRARIDELTKIVKEKDKEIERLKNLFELNNEVVINQGKEIFDLRVQVLQQKQNQTQLTLQELEKVKTLIQNAINFEKPNFVEVYDTINKQINDLRGTKDVED